jgi:hypothetical protein
MKHSVYGFLVFISILFSVSGGQTITFNHHKFAYKISKDWEVSQQSEEGGYYTILLKRSPIIDKNKVEVIPNILIKLIKVADDSKDSDNDIMMFTQTCLLYNAPPEVRDDFVASKNKEIKYMLPIANSYSFNSPYKDKFNSNHTCLYLTAFDSKKYGIFICIDSTEEVFATIENEVTDFLKSISMDNK